MKLMKGVGSCLSHFFGVVRDGRAWDSDANGLYSDSTDAWYMFDEGELWGNGKEYSDGAGGINDGQIISMIADLDKGTLRFWLDGQPHGPGWSSGVKGTTLECEYVFKRPGCSNCANTGTAALDTTSAG